MPQHILITGGAGFIGSHLCDELLGAGHQVRVLDNLCPQVHGEGCVRPEYLDEDVELIRGDVRDAEAVKGALKGIDAVYHFAARVGVGQSMYEVEEYTDVNNVGTAVLLEALAQRPVGRLVVASSMSIYGEGLYKTADGGFEEGADRAVERLRAGDFEVRGKDGKPLAAVPTPEWKRPNLASVYALSKYDQERLCLVMGRAYNIPTVALRFFNVYGTRQALSNPYTGVLAIFASRLLNERAPQIFEDGEQRRDFVAVEDVARACHQALTSKDAPGLAINVGSGRSFTVKEVASSIAEVMGRASIRPDVTKKVRVGDIRHCFADITLARQVLGYRPQVEFQSGLRALAQWLEGQVAVDAVEKARAELDARGLTL